MLSQATQVPAKAHILHCSPKALPTDIHAPLRSWLVPLILDLPHLSILDLPQQRSSDPQTIMEDNHPRLRGMAEEEVDPTTAAAPQASV